MIKEIAIALFMAAPCLASGPLYGPSYDSVKTNQEFQNAYHDITSPNIGVGTASTMTITGLIVTTVTVSAKLDMSNKKIVNLANGTASTDAAAFGQIPTFVDWTAYAPTTPTNVTLGNGTISGFYRRLGNSVTIRVNILAGSTTSIGGLMKIQVCIPGGFSINWTLLDTTTDVWAIGFGHFYDTSASTHYVGTVRKDTSGGGVLYLSFQGGLVVTSGSPVTIATGDTISFEYEVPIS